MNSGRGRKELLLLIGSIVVSLLMGEFAVRRFMPPPARLPTAARGLVMAENLRNLQSLHWADPQIGWVLNADLKRHRQRLVDERGSVQYDVVYSLDGGQRVASAHPPSGPAIIATGTSFTFGHGLNDQDTWPWLLQEQLPAYHVMNVACMGYGTDQALLAAERQVLRAPGHTAVVVLELEGFQIERNRSAQGWLAMVYPFAKPLFAIGPGGVEYKRQVRFWSPGILGDYSAFYAHLVNVLANRTYGIPSHAQAKELTARLVIAFAQRMQAQGVRLAVVMTPYVGDQGPEARSDRAFLVEQLNAAHIPTLAPDFPRLADGGIDIAKFMVSKVDRHPNRQYNVIVVDQLVRFLRSMGAIAQ